MVRHVKPSDWVEGKDFAAQCIDSPLERALDAYFDAVEDAANRKESGTEATLFLARTCSCIVRGKRLPANPFRRRKLERERRRLKVLRGECIKCTWPHLPEQQQCWHHQLKNRLRNFNRREKCNCHQTRTQLSLCFSEPSSESDSSSGTSNQSRMARRRLRTGWTSSRTKGDCNVGGQNHGA